MPQKLPEKTEKQLEKVQEEIHIEENSILRYTAYAARLKSIALASKRYLAYSSDFGEAFRPLTHPWVVQMTYGISWAYVCYDVGMHGYEVHLKNALQKDQKEYRRELGMEVSKRFTFQALASMILPAFTIHSTVKYSSLYIFQKMNRFVKWGPTITGLACVPFLPFLFDEPVEWGVDLLWKEGFGYTSRHTKHD